jgi:hypothetical protein
MSARVVSVLQREGGATITFAHDAETGDAFALGSQNGTFYVGKVGKRTPQTPQEWNLLPTFRLVAEDEQGRSRWEAAVSR